MASTAVSTVPCPVKTITGTPGVFEITSRKTSSPLISGIFRSVITRSTSSFKAISKPVFPLSAVITS